MQYEIHYKTHKWLMTTTFYNVYRSIWHAGLLLQVLVQYDNDFMVKTIFSPWGAQTTEGGVHLKKTKIILKNKYFLIDEVFLLIKKLHYTYGHK